ncbi:MAG: hypothetical protein HC900_06915 [Methylacidiphilales bacterium]|nr:hypothetical protein [Candidatus Methylacidiphilales bacterium]
MVRVWSPVIRIGHWTLVTAFAVAYLTEDDLLQVHNWAGYVAAGAVLVRLLWGVFGPEQDRFSHFLRPPGEVLSYLADAVRLRSRRYIGHSPAAGAIALLLLLSMAATTGTGMVTLAETRNAGPLAPWFGAPRARPRSRWRRQHGPTTTGATGTVTAAKTAIARKAVWRMCTSSSPI